jgi:hypothetical protein
MTGRTALRADGDRMALLLILLELAGIGLISYAMSRQLAQALPGRGIYYVLMAPGTVFHELSHAVACLLLGLRIERVSLFHPRRKGDGSVELGSVEYLSKGRMRPLLVGIAPLLFATVLIALLSRVLLPAHAGAAKLLASPGTYLFVAIVFLLGLALSPSRQDLRGLLPFVFVAALLSAAVVLATRFTAGAERFSRFSASLNSFLGPASRSMVAVIVVMLALLLVMISGRFLLRR